MAHMRVGPDGFNYYLSRAGAHIAFPPGWEGVTKRDILKAAMAAGRGEDMDAKKGEEIKDEPQRDT